MSSGGGGGGSGTQTNITELPEWARPYAQDILARGKTLTEQTDMPKYKDSRYAGLSDLQKKAIDSVSTPEAYQKSLQGFMDPYAQNVIDIQKREAGRQSQMAGLQEAGQAVKSGAFGGSRAGLVEAERARNTGQLMSDIQARGSEAAYQNAQQALQRDIANKMQLGSVQQADIQRPMDIAYQDFLNEQNYPYKQLGFMSDLLRGTPTGSSSAMTMYQAPGNLMGQLGGLGMGAYGLSRLMAKEGGLMESSYAEGGEVQGYKRGGGVDLSMMDDKQLARAYQGALDRRDIDLANAIEQQMMEHRAMRQAEDASLAYGLGNAFDQIPEEDQERMMANGGIVAFADKGAVKADPEYFQDPMGAPSYAPEEDLSIKKALRQTVRMGEEYTPSLRGTLFGYDVQPKAEPEGPKVSATYPDESSRGSAASSAAPKSVSKPKIDKGIGTALTKMSEETGVPKATLEDEYASMFKRIQGENADDMKSLNDLIKRSLGGSKKVKEEALGRALAEYGFAWAQAASKPGARFIGSAAEASPVIARSVAESDKIAREMDANDLRIGMATKQFEIAQRAGNRKDALAFANQKRMLEQSQQELALKRKQLDQTAAYQNRHLDILAQKASSGSGLQKAYLTGLQQSQNRAARLAEKNWNNPLTQQELKKQGYTSFDQYYDAVKRKEMRSAVPIFGVTPAGEDDED